ncbi:MAG: histidine--tRNA ligase [Nitrospirae bacterium RBG_19FT_COMBO_55_12]|nr:MAG: histidine--tRNA ligase [Nitrospirae bacterium RBG_19FT_COMBO_55_12]
MNIQAIKGVKDILPEDMPAWQHLEATARKLFEDYGFAEIRVPIFEYTELFARSIGASTDIVEKEMYTFEDRDGRKITLRPEGTAGVVRAFVEHKMYAQNALTKLYYTGPMFRHERPQKGRFRQFYQIGVEALGMDHPHVDVEILAVVHQLYARLGISGLALQINSLGDKACRGKYRDALKAYLKNKLTTLCADCRRRYETNPMRVLDCKVDADKFGDSPVMLDYLCDPCKAHFHEVESGLEKLGIPYEVNPRLVRGLDYYTRTTFELVMGHMGAQNTVAAGGRYDGLVEEIGGPPTSGIGFALGVERTVSLMDTGNLLPLRPALYIAALGEEAVRLSLPFIHELRQAGIGVDTVYSGASLKSQMKKADKSGAGHTLILGEQEIKNGKAVLRNMQTKEQKEVPLQNIVEELRKTLS